MLQDITHDVLRSLGNGRQPTRVVMSKKMVEKFSSEMKRMKNFTPEADEGYSTLLDRENVGRRLVPRAIPISIENKVTGQKSEMELIVKVSEKVPEDWCRLDYEPLLMNPVSGRME